MADDTALLDATQPLSFAEFLEKMKDPAASDLVRTIKQFIKTFDELAPDPARDSALVQDFLLRSEAAFRVHPVWAKVPGQHQQQAIEGLEKYLMTKIYSKTFGVAAEDRERDAALAARMEGLAFVRPDHLDIPQLYQDEKAWLLAMKELHKINNYKAPRDKLVCILNCCRVINNLLHVGIQDGEARGADDFLPVLIYVVIHANPPQLASNLLYIERFRMASRMMSESAYFFTQLYSAASFVETINSGSLTMEPDEFLARMVEAGVTHLPSSPPDAPVARISSQSVPAALPSPPHNPNKGFGSAGSTTSVPYVAQGRPSEVEQSGTAPLPDSAQQVLSPTSSAAVLGGESATWQDGMGYPQMLPVVVQPQSVSGGTIQPRGVPAGIDSAGAHMGNSRNGASTRLSVAALEAEGVPSLLEAAAAGQLQQRHRFLSAAAADLRVSDVSLLLSEYKELVLRYEALSFSVSRLAASSNELTSTATAAAAPLQGSANAAQRPLQHYPTVPTDAGTASTRAEGGLRTANPINGGVGPNMIPADEFLTSQPAAGAPVYEDHTDVQFIQSAPEKSEEDEAQPELVKSTTAAAAAAGGPSIDPFLPISNPTDSSSADGTDTQHAQDTKVSVGNEVSEDSQLRTDAEQATAVEGGSGPDHDPEGGLSAVEGRSEHLQAQPGVEAHSATEEGADSEDAELAAFRADLPSQPEATADAAADVSIHSEAAEHAGRTHNPISIHDENKAKEDEDAGEKEDTSSVSEAAYGHIGGGTTSSTTVVDQVEPVSEPVPVKVAGIVDAAPSAADSGVSSDPPAGVDHSGEREVATHPEREGGDSMSGEVGVENEARVVVTEVVALPTDAPSDSMLVRDEALHESRSEQSHSEQAEHLPVLSTAQPTVEPQEEIEPSCSVSEPATELTPGLKHVGPEKFPALMSPELDSAEAVESVVQASELSSPVVGSTNVTENSALFEGLDVELGSSERAVGITADHIADVAVPRGEQDPFGITSSMQEVGSPASIENHALDGSLI